MVKEVQFQAHYHLCCECQGVCGCEEDEEYVKRHWEAEIVEPPDHGIHVAECEDETCEGGWLFEIDGPLALFMWMADNLAAKGGQVLVDGKMVDSWIVYL